jgi:hypothetical protein
MIEVFSDFALCMQVYFPIISLNVHASFPLLVYLFSFIFILLYFVFFYSRFPHSLIVLLCFGFGL